MKYLLLIFAIYIFSANTIKAQYILAGNHNFQDNYTDYNPDSVINCTGWSGGCTSIEFPLDINGDGIIDIKVRGNNSQGAMGSQTDYVHFIAGPNAKIAYGYIDTCYGIYFCSQDTDYYTMAKTFMNNDTIGNSVNWSNDSILYLDYETVVMNCWNCRNGLSTTSTRVYGVKVINQSDTLFGWIRFKDIYVNTFSSGFTIEEYACNKGSADIKDINESSQLQVFPNPCKSKIMIGISFPFTKCLLTLFDINGHILLIKPIPDNEVQIDISSLSSGVYFIKLVTENKVIVRKLLKE